MCVRQSDHLYNGSVCYHHTYTGSACDVMEHRANLRGYQFTYIVALSVYVCTSVKSLI